MNWFNTFSRTKIDLGILDLYLEIEMLIEEINKKMEDYLNYVISSKYYQTNSKDKKYYTIQKVNYFFKKLRDDYAYCYTLRKNKKMYNFNKNSQALAEKLEIETQLKNIIEILNLIETEVNNLKKTNLSENDFSELVKTIGKLVKNEHILKEIQEKDGSKVEEIINKILTESEINEKNKIYLLSQKDKKSKLLFSQTLSLNEIKYLELVPLLQLKNLEKRSLFINELHKDETLPVYHYNLEFNGKNIHVIPNNYKDKIKPYIV